MAKELVINQTHNETRIALIENGDISDFLLDRGSVNEKPSVGNIYLGKVLRVLPGMQSAFVDIGYEKAAFLYVNDAYIPLDGKLVLETSDYVVAQAGANSTLKILLSVLETANA